MQMVVMDYVSHLGVTPPNAVERIRAVLYKLHRKGYVFVDLRAQNILFDENGKVKFIDFDLSGRYDMNVRDESLPADFQKRIDDEKTNVKSVSHYVCYPLNLSLNIHWAHWTYSAWTWLVYVAQFTFIESFILFLFPFFVYP